MLKNHRKNVSLCLILILGLFLRLPLLNGSFWLDEAAQALEVVRPLNQQLDIVADFQPPLLHLILHFVQYFSHSEWWLRSFGALIPGLITIFLTYKLGEKIFNKKVATLASIFLATSSFHIFFSQELRPYSLPTMFAVSSMFFFYLTIFENKNKKNIYAFLLLLSNLFGLFSSYLFPFLMIGQFALSLFRNSKKYIYLQIIPFVSFIFWLPTFFKQLEAGNLVRSSLPNWENVVSIPQIKSLPLVFGKFIFGVLSIDLNLFFIFFGAVIILSTIYLLFSKLSVKQDLSKLTKLIFIIFWLLIPLLTAWMISFIVPVVRPKRVLYLLPAFYLLLAYLIEEFYSKKPIQKLISSVLFLSLISVNIFSTASYYSSPSLQRENWKSLSAEISRNYSPSDTILVYSFSDQFAPMSWYQKNEFKYLATGKLYVKDVDDLANELKSVVEYDNVLVFDYLRDLTDPDKEIEKVLSGFGYKEVGIIDYPNIGFIRVLSRPNSLIGSK